MVVGRNPRRSYERDGAEITPATIADTAAHGVTELHVSCGCGHEAAVPIDRFHPESYVPDAGLRLRCSACGRRGPTTQPAWPPGMAPRHP